MNPYPCCPCPQQFPVNQLPAPTGQIFCFQTPCPPQGNLFSQMQTCHVDELLRKSMDFFVPQQQPHESFCCAPQPQQSPFCCSPCPEPPRQYFCVPGYPQQIQPQLGFPQAAPQLCNLNHLQDRASYELALLQKQLVGNPLTCLRLHTDGTTSTTDLFTQQTNNVFRADLRNLAAAIGQECRLENQQNIKQLHLQEVTKLREETRSIVTEMLQEQQNAQGKTGDVTAASEDTSLQTQKKIRFRDESCNDKEVQFHNCCNTKWDEEFHCLLDSEIAAESTRSDGFSSEEDSSGHETSADDSDTKNKKHKKKRKKPKQK